MLLYLDLMCRWVDAEDPLFMLYTSGSTGMHDMKYSVQCSCTAYSQLKTLFFFFFYFGSFFFILKKYEIFQENLKVYCTVLLGTCCTRQQPLSTHSIISQRQMFTGVLQTLDGSQVPYGCNVCKVFRASGSVWIHIMIYTDFYRKVKKRKS